ncbi:MAG: hypothetical protein HUU17_01355 [Chthonomonadales bacterium]|nr:hypothetical protein [Chthonomonadales bacterium]
MITGSENESQEPDARVSRRQLMQGALSTGAVLAFSGASALAGGERQTAAKAGADPAAGQASFIAGAAKRIITPDPLLPVSGGLGMPNPVKEKRGDLFARALYLRNRSGTALIISLDLLGFPSVLAERVRARVPKVPGANIVIGSTHTHSAPDCYAFPDGKGGHTGDLAFMERVCVLAAEAANEAIERAVPAILHTATDEARGKIAYNYYAPDLYDRRMSVLQVRNARGGACIATLVNYAIHPEVLGSEVGILSPDLCGPLYDRIEAKAGGMALFMNGAQGGMVTADNRLLDQPSDPLRGYWKDARTWEECERIGGLMADEALRIVDKAPAQTNPTVYCGATMVTFPVDSPELWAVVTLSPLKYPHGDERTIRTRMNCLTIGDSQVLTIPGEALPNIGFYLKRAMRGEHNLVFGLTNDAFGYIMTKVDFRSFPAYTYISRVSLGEMTGEILIEQALTLIAATPAPDASPQSGEAGKSPGDKVDRPGA